MDDFKFIEEEEENNIANDDSDVQEEGTNQYEEHFWCKANVVPVCFTYKDSIRASDNIKSNFQNAAKGSPKFMDNSSLAAKGALANRLQRRTACKIQNGCQGAPKCQRGVYP